MTVGIRIAGVGVEVPPLVVTTAEVEERAGLAALGFEPGWLERTTGVRERRWADPSVRPSALASSAARKALDDAGVNPSAVDVLLFCGITRDFIEPATANVVQASIGASRARVFDITNACNGLLDGFDVAHMLIETGRAQRVLVTTGERASISIDFWPQNAEEVLRAAAGLIVADGGGAILIDGSAEPGRGVREREYRSDGRHWELAVGGRFRSTREACKACGSVVDLRFHCDGRRMFHEGVRFIPEVMNAVMERTGWDYEELDVVLCHEGSKRFVESGIDQVAKHAGPKTWSTVERYGNTTTVSLPLQLWDARQAGILVPGAKILMLGGSAGLSMAAITYVW